MHICFVAIDFHSPGGGGGIASYVQTVGKALVERGHTVTIVAKGRKREWRQVDGFDVLYWPLGNLHWYWKRVGLPIAAVLPIRELEWSWGIRQAVQAVQNRKPIDIIEACETGIQFLATLDIPFIVRLHGEPYIFAKYSGQPLHMGLRLQHKLELGALRRASAVTSPSRFQAHEIATDLGWDAVAIEVVPNPISPNFLDEQEVELQIDNLGEKKGPIVLFTGRIDLNKGTLVLLEAVPRVAAAYPEVTFVIAGGRHASIDDQCLKEALSKPNTSEYVQFLGHIAWQEVASWYRMADLAVVPSYYETFGISAIEAMAFDVPVVGSCTGGLTEVIDNGRTGVLVPAGNSQSLAQAIIRLLGDEQLRRQLGEAGREKVLAEYSVEHIVAKNISLYREVRRDNKEL